MTSATASAAAGDRAQVAVAAGVSNDTVFRAKAARDLGGHEQPSRKRAALHSPTRRPVLSRLHRMREGVRFARSEVPPREIGVM